MCVAIIKPKGIKPPSMKVLKKCWDGNPDGAGFSFIDNEKHLVRIIKGMMTFENFKKKWKEYDMSNHEGIMFIHFRIGTHGGNNAGNTHPFPISGNISELKCQDILSSSVLMHNGVIELDFPPRQRDISDTMELVLRIAELGNGVNYKNVLSLLKDSLSDQKIAILEKSGKVATIGNWYEIDGVYYSNTYWRDGRPRCKKSSCNSWSLHDYSLQDDSYYDEYEYDYDTMEKMSLSGDDRKTYNIVEDMTERLFGNSDIDVFKYVLYAYHCFNEWMNAYPRKDMVFDEIFMDNFMAYEDSTPEVSTPGFDVEEFEQWYKANTNNAKGGQDEIEFWSK